MAPLFKMLSSNSNHTSSLGADNGSLLQPSLKVGEPGDKYEQEADRVADSVMRMPNPQLLRQPIEEEEEEMVQMQAMEEELQMQPVEEEEEEQLQMQLMEEEEELQMKFNSEAGNQGASEVSGEISQKINSSKGSGTLLESNIQQEMSAKMGSDFSDVQVHTNGRAAELNENLGARAFTHGNDIYFNYNQYNPNSHQGKHLLAHELTHVEQQKGKKTDIAAKELPGAIIQFNPMTDDERGNMVEEISDLMGTTHTEYNVGATLAEQAIAAANAADANVAKTIFSMTMALIVPGFGGVVAGGFARFGINLAGSTATNIGNAIGEAAKSLGNEAIDSAYAGTQPTNFFVIITEAMERAARREIRYLRENKTNRDTISDQELRDLQQYWESLANNNRNTWSTWFQEQWTRYEQQILAIGDQSPGIVPFGATIDIHRNTPANVRMNDGSTRLALITHTQVTHSRGILHWLLDIENTNTTFRFVRWIDEDLAELARAQVSSVPTLDESRVTGMP
ncbi:DUF4157 domain-containing protein [Aliifodinibius sp. S!AR15-10]|uniref:eCIS core domain-containing protein n=1 Tax=Aliifodinibius sp. S!AR15-10 TaxID=2950437 RepID=UPI0028621508|nr:DUF4157 domain-containing protein [Aliifodinibius sp. S!AR15-10]MDR8390605.1 DUF4157 domain-containing protein [Aliifodinibius sp. S!AR15-10]